MARALRPRALLAAAGAAAFVAALAAKAALDPRSAFLPARPPARWLRAEAGTWLGTRQAGPRFARFRAAFEAGAAGVEAELSLRALDASELVLDGRELLPPGAAEGGRRAARRAVLRAGPGRHELIFVIRADGGPPLLWAEAPVLGLYSGPRWQASVDGGRTWAPAVDAEQPLRAAELDVLPGAARGLRATTLLLLPFVALGLWCARRLERPADERALAAALPACAAAAWLALAAAALRKLGPGVGYDAAYHAAYVEALARTGRLLAPGQFWQSFEPPLYYLLCVPLRAAAVALGRDVAAALRLPNLLAGFVLGWACRLFVATARPGRPRLALAAGLFGWFWPASLTLAQAPGCEPLAGALGALFLVACARAAARERAPGTRAALALGALFGAAVLAKATAALVLAPGLLLLAAPARRAGPGGRLRLAAAFGAAALLVGGWFYARSWALYGAPLIGDWNAGGPGWWQEPGARAAGDFLRLGAALARPFYAGLNGFWDALYSTFWADGWQSGAIRLRSLPPRPFEWQAAEVWWGLIPSALIARGAARAISAEDAPSGAALLGAAAGLAALAWMFAALPIYGTVKASYLLSLGPLFALLLADGLDALARAPRAAAWAGLVAWAAAAYRGALPL